MEGKRSQERDQQGQRSESRMSLQSSNGQPQRKTDKRRVEEEGRGQIMWGSVDPGDHSVLSREGSEQGRDVT